MSSTELLSPKLLLSSYTRKPTLKRKRAISMNSDWKVLVGCEKPEVIPSKNSLTSTPNYLHYGFTTSRKSIKVFCTHSSYDGEWDMTGFSGYGQYVFADGTVYDGEFEDGLFHGKGCITFPTTGQSMDKKIEANFCKGNVDESSMVFVFGSERVHKDNFKYCQMPNRRFAIETPLVNLPPIGKETLTSKKDPQVLGPTDYDVVYGVFDTRRNIIISDDVVTGVQEISIPAPKEESWIKENCRYGSDVPVGYIPKFYEAWTAGRRWERQKYGFEESDESEESTEVTTEQLSSKSHTSDVMEAFLQHIQDVDEGGKDELVTEDKKDEEEYAPSVCNKTSSLDRPVLDHLDYYDKVEVGEEEEKGMEEVEEETSSFDFMGLSQGDSDKSLSKWIMGYCGEQSDVLDAHTTKTDDWLDQYDNDESQEVLTNVDYLDSDDATEKFLHPSDEAMLGA